MGHFDSIIAMKKIVVAMSGGVDSSVTAWLLKEAGYEVIGVSLRLAPGDESCAMNKLGHCCSAEDMNDARQVCDKIGVPFYAIDARDKFKEAVIKPFVQSYAAGKTPNPCIECNHKVKFGNLFDTVKSLGAGLATGHYASVCEYKSGFRHSGLNPESGDKLLTCGDEKPLLTLKRPKDVNKDQTYYLYGTPTDVLAVLELPLGKFEKREIRKLAEKIGLRVSDKPDSQEICFVPDDNHARVVEQYLGELPTGDLVHIGGKKIAKHKGIHHYTIGQRRGIGVGIGSKAYVVDINVKNNQVTIGPKEALQCESLQVEDVRQMLPIDLWPKEVLVQIRSHGKAQPASWELLENEQLEIKFKELVFAVALGQAAVIYDGDFVLGGGVISGKS